MRWKSRERLFLKCVEGMVKAPHVRLTVVVQDHGNACHEFAFPPEVHVVKVHGSSLLWSKESMINAGVARLPNGWKYMAWIDGDITFRDHNWAGETLHFL